jgi:agmatine/peptidylarginine deiminase
MKRLRIAMLAGLALGSVACGDSSLEPEEGLQPRVAAVGQGQTILPRGLTAEELSRTESDPSHGAAQAYAWECNPELYGFSAAPGAVRFPGEYVSTTGLIIGWPQYGCDVTELTELIRTALGRTQVTVLVGREFQRNAEQCLQRRGISAAQLAQVEWVNMPVDSIWVRDYGPEVVTAADGSRQLIDMSYYPQLSDTCNNLAGRVNDDAVPTRLAAAWGTPVHRAKVRLEGGNLLTDGAGNCFRARDSANRRNCFSRWCYTEEELNEVIGGFHGCRVHTLESMVGGVIDHVDMWMTIISRNTILVGRYDVADDPENAAILDRNARRLSAMGYRVVRVPMPKPYCRTASATCTGNAALIGPCGPASERIWATYMNSIRLGNALAVPVFRWVPDSHKATIAAQEAEALSIYQRELDRAFGPGAVQVVRIQSDGIIPCQGSLHCTTMTYR